MQNDYNKTESMDTSNRSPAELEPPVAMTPINFDLLRKASEAYYVNAPDVKDEVNAIENTKRSQGP